MALPIPAIPARPAAGLASFLLTPMLAFFLLATTLPALAGPLRDRLLERRGAQQSESSEAEQASGTTTMTAADWRGVRIVRDIAYGSDERQRFDVYAPQQAVKNAPVIVMVHGGAWAVGDKKNAAVVENKVARWVSRGLILVSANYRLLPTATPLQQAEDIARALAAVQEKAAEWGGDRSKVILIGHSAGAHLVALLAASPALATAAGATPWLGTIALDSAAYDLPQIMATKHYRFYDQAFGSDPAYWRATSPIHVLQKATAPFLAVCSSTRPDRPCRQAQAFVSKDRELGAQATLLEQALSHGDINQQLGRLPDYTAAVEAFMRTLDATLAQRLKE